MLLLLLPAGMLAMPSAWSGSKPVEVGVGDPAVAQDLDSLFARDIVELAQLVATDIQP